MRSMPQALLWETFSNGRWSLPGMFLLAIILPLLVYGSLSGFPMDVRAREFVLLQATFLLIVIFQLAVGVYMAQGPLSRLYTLPISVNSIVAWHMFSGALILAAMTVASACLFNTLFRVEWPIWGPALFSAAAWSALQVLVCISSHQSLPGICVAGTPSILLAWWLLSRYGACHVYDWSPPKHFWNELTTTEAATLVGAFGICYVMTTYGVRFARCGERIPSFGIWKWLSACWDAYETSRTTPPPFRSATAAHFWYERQKGIALPLVELFVLVLAVVGVLAEWYLRNSGLNSSYEVVLSLGGFISLLAVPFGIYIGLEIDTKCVGQRETQLGDSLDQLQLDTVMGSFLGSRPITDWDFAKVTLRTAAQSVFFTWLLWFVVFIGCLLILWLTSQFPNSLMPRNFGWLYMPLTILGPWIAMANLGTAGHSGRGARILFYLVFFFVGYFVLMGIIQHFTSITFVEMLHVVCISIATILLIIAGIWAFATACRQKQLTKRALLVASLAIGLLTIGGIMLLPAGSHYLAYLMVIAFAVLVVLPFATMPLAIAWNRHR